MPEPNSVQFQDTGFPDLSGGQSSGAGRNDLLWFNAAFGLTRDPIPRWWTPYRDMYFREYIQGSTVLAGILYSRTTSIKNLEWQIVADDETFKPLIPFYADMLNRAQFGEGFRSFLHRWVLDYYSQDNGAFVELVGRQAIVPYIVDGQTLANVYNYLPKDGITDLNVFDSGQCYRTPDSEYPVIYTNPWFANRSILHWSRVHRVSQFTSNLELARGLGLCAVSRSLEALNIIRYSNEYITEKMTGQSPEIVLANNIAIKAVEQALQDGAIANDALGRVRFKGFTFIQGNSTPHGSPELVKTELKTTPDGWDRWKEVTLAMYMIAMGFGTDVRDLGFPAQHTGETKADAEIQDLKTSNRGRADAKQELEDMINLRVLPRGLRFEFDFKDDLEDQRKAEIALMRNQARVEMVANGIITPDEARQIAAQDGDIPHEFLNTIMVADGGVMPTIEGEEGEELGTKSYNSQVRIPFQQGVTQILLKTNANVYDKTTALEDVIFRYGTEAYIKGLQDAGDTEAVSEGLLEPEARQELNGLLSTQYSYAFNAVLETEGADSQTVNRHAFLWANKGLDTIYNAGLLMGNSGQKYEWVLGDTEHCGDCLRLSGRVYKARTWRKHGVYPRSSMLACKGYQCECKLVKTDKPATKGKPPAISGQKAHEHQEERT